MKRIFGMMPSSEVELRESYKDNFGLTVRIEAGKHGWTIMWADGGSDYKDVDTESAIENFTEAFETAQNRIGKLVKVRCCDECCGEC